MKLKIETLHNNFITSRQFQWNVLQVQNMLPSEHISPELGHKIDY